MPKRNQTTIKRRKDTTITTKFLPNKIRKIVSSFENIYVSNNTCVLKFFDKNNNIKILKIQGLSQSKVAKELSIGIATVKRYWNL